MKPQINFVLESYRIGLILHILQLRYQPGKAGVAQLEERKTLKSGISS